jgi:hypothetical protein
MSLSCRVGVLLLLFASLSAAETVSLAVSPAPPPRNLYRWQLLPGLLVQKPGDAIEAYRKVHAAIKEVEPDQAAFARLTEEMDKLRMARLEDVDRVRVKEIVEQFKKPLGLVEQAARCEQANWDFLVERLRKSGISTLLPEIQEMREIVPLLAMQARLHLLEDRPEEAVKVVATGLSLARHMDECPTLIGHLVAIALARISLDMLADCTSHPKCPSLYGPLTDLPRPFLSPRKGYEGERISCYGTVPGLAKIAANPAGTELDAETVATIIRLFRGLSDDERPLTQFRIVDRYTLGLAMQKSMKAAQEAMRTAGYDEETIKKTPAINAGLLYGVLQYEEGLGRMAAAAMLPYPQASAQLDEINKTFPFKRPRGAKPDEPPFPLARMLLPAGDKVLLADLRLQRRIDLLRVAEGLRQHAAQAGKWPEKLADVKVVPLPDDPATGKPFAYTRDGDTITLDAPAPKRGISSDHTLTVTLTLRKPEEKKPEEKKP